MKVLITILRYGIVSCEFLVIVIGAMVYLFAPEWFEWLSARIGRDGEILKHFGLLPAGLFVFDLSAVKQVLFPESDKRSILQKWKLYWNLRWGCLVGIVYGGLFTIGGIVAWFFEWQKPLGYYAAVLLVSVSGALTVSGSLYYANIKIEELFRANSKRSE